MFGYEDDTPDAQWELYNEIRSIIWFTAGSPDRQAALIIEQLGLVQEDRVLTYPVADEHHTTVTRTIRGRSKVTKDTERGVGVEDTAD